MDLVCVGIGNFGLISRQLAELYSHNVTGFIDLNPHSALTSFDDLPCFPITSSFPEDQHFLISTNRFNHTYLSSIFTHKAVFLEQITQSLIQDLNNCSLAGITWSRVKTEAELRSYLRIREISGLTSHTQAFSVPSLDVVLTERCSLKCESCSNLMQYYTKPKHISLDTILLAIEKIFNASPVDTIRLIGGEPLLHPDLPSILDFLHSNYRGRYQTIEIYTNATLLPSQELVKSAVRSSSVFYISDYQELSRNLEGFISSLNANSISYALESNLTWQDCGTITATQVVSQVSKYSNCCVSKTFSLIGSQLYSCPFSANFHNLYPDSATSRDCIDVLNTPSLRQSLFDLLINSTPLTACANCHGRDYSTDTVPVATQTRQILPLPVL